MKTKTVVILIIFFFISIQAQQEHISYGKGSSEKGAKLDACQKGMARFIKSKLGYGIYKTHKRYIEKFLKTNWSKYCDLKEVEIIKIYRNRRIGVAFSFKEKRLLKGLFEEYPGMAARWVESSRTKKKFKKISDPIVAEGKGLSKKGAIVEAWKKVIHSYLEKKLGIDYESYDEDIERFLKTNWSKYAYGNYLEPEIVKGYRNRVVTIRGQIRIQELLEALEYEIPELEISSDFSIATNEITIFVTKSSSYDKNVTLEEEQIAIDQINEVLEHHFTVFESGKDLKAALKKKALEEGLSPHSDPKSYLKFKYTFVKVAISCSLTIQEQKDSEGIYYYPTITINAKHRPTSSSLCLFSMTSGSGTTTKAKPGYAPKDAPGAKKKARQQAVANLAKYAAAKIRHKILKASGNW